MMKNLESNNLKTPQLASNVSAIKSQKILNSLSNFNLKTQTDRQQEHRSPQNNRSQKVQLRQTWRRPRMPYNKLPEAFNQQKNRRSKNNQQAISNINKIVQHTSSKKATQYLEPIKLDKKQEQNKKKYAVQNRNPLIPFLKYKQMQKRINDQFKEMNDLSIDKLKNQFKFNGNPIRVNQCITLEVIKRGHHTGTIKKMLHVPTLKVICVREEPLNSKESRMAIKDWINIWHNKLQPSTTEPSNNFLTIYYEQFNYPEGAVSILTQYLKGGSLLTLLQFVRTLPQSIIRQIIDQLLKILSEFYDLSGMNFGGMSPSQLMFTEQGKLKLGLGLYYHFPNINSDNIYYLKSSTKANVFDFNATQYRFMKNSIEKPVNLELQVSYDIFKIGLILLECSIGSLQNFQQTNLVYDAVKYLFTQNGQKQAERQNICCLMHSQNILIDLASQFSDNNRTRRDKTDPGKNIQYIRFLKDRYSNQFINFLCVCLKIQHSKRATFNDLLGHNFVVSYKDPDNSTVKVSLKDMLKISGGYLQQNILQSVIIYNSSIEKSIKGVKILSSHFTRVCRMQEINNSRFGQQLEIKSFQSIEIDLNELFELGKEIVPGATVDGQERSVIFSDNIFSLIVKKELTINLLELQDSNERRLLAKVNINQIKGKLR